VKAIDYVNWLVFCDRVYSLVDDSIPNRPQNKLYFQSVRKAPTMDSSTQSIRSFPSSSTKTRGISASETWKHARAAKDTEIMYREGRQIWYCIYCKGDTVYSSDVTTNFRRHLHTKHSIEVFPESSPLKIEIAEQFQKLWRRVKEEGRTEEIGNEIFEKYLDQEVVNEALVSLIVVRNLPSRVVE